MQLLLRATILLACFGTLFFALGRPASQPSRVELPQSIAGRKASRLMAAINSQSPSALSEFVSETYANEYFPKGMSREVSRLKSLSEELGKLTPIAIEDDSAQYISLFAHAEKPDSTYRVVISLSGLPYYLIVSLTIEPA